MRLAVKLANFFVLGDCIRVSSAVPKEDHRILNNLATESSQLLADATSRAVSLFDFGMTAVAKELTHRMSLQFDPYPLLQFIRSLGQETYENQRLSYGLIISRTMPGHSLFQEAFENKRFKRLSDGFSTALVIDQSGKIAGLVPLESPNKEGLAITLRPRWSAGMAETAKEHNGIGISLTRSNDMVIVEGGRLLFSYRAGKWQRWNHTELKQRIRGLWDFRGTPAQLTHVLSHLYHVAMDLSFRRSGGILAVVENTNSDPDALLASKKDKIKASSRSAPELAIDQTLDKHRVQSTDRRVIEDLASLDGALILDRSGQLRAWGAMVVPSRSALQGARTRAAVAASTKGIAIKVSSDGDIEIYRKGKKELVI